MSRRRKVAFPVHGHARNRVTSKIKATFQPGGSLDAESIVTTTDADARIVEVVVETPKGSHNKLKYDPERAAFRFSHVLPIGMTFPFDFGFLPDTAGGDGDPLDVLVLMDAPCPMGCLVDVRLVGVLEVEQRQKTGDVVRNDRLIGVAETSATHASAHELQTCQPRSLRDRSLLRPVQPARREAIPRAPSAGIAGSAGSPQAPRCVHRSDHCELADVPVKA